MRTPSKRVLAVLLGTLLLGACQASGTPSELPSASAVIKTPVSEPAPSLIPIGATATPRRLPTAAPSPAPTSAEAWQSWPVVPVVPMHVREIFDRGQSLGNDAHAFSILGDCQSLPDNFLGVYDTQPSVVASLPAQLQETVAYFAGTFNRESPTIKSGTTAGALLWIEWHEGKYTCGPNETPVDCELRLHRPSFVVFNVGTHYESRNIDYLRRILDQLVANGVVPILATKADNRELDERINLDMVTLAVEYDVPLWNFWAATGDLPNRGLYTKTSEPHLGDIYLNEEGLQRHRFTALETLDVVRRTALGE